MHRACAGTCWKQIEEIKKTEEGLGKLGLNDATIDKLQNYYGIAVRSNSENLKAMKQSIYAAWCHVASSKDKKIP